MKFAIVHVQIVIFTISSLIQDNHHTQLKIIQTRWNLQAQIKNYSIPQNLTSKTKITSNPQPLSPIFQKGSNRNHSRIGVLQSENQSIQLFENSLQSNLWNVLSDHCIQKIGEISKASPFYHSLGRSSFNLANNLALLKAFPRRNHPRFPLTEARRPFFWLAKTDRESKLLPLNRVTGIDQTSRGTQDASGTRVFDPVEAHSSSRFNRSRRYNSN